MKRLLLALALTMLAFFFWKNELKIPAQIAQSYLIQKTNTLEERNRIDLKESLRSCRKVQKDLFALLQAKTKSANKAAVDIARLEHLLKSGSANVEVLEDKAAVLHQEYDEDLKNIDFLKTELRALVAEDRDYQNALAQFIPNDDDASKRKSRAKRAMASQDALSKDATKNEEL